MKNYWMATISHEHVKKGVKEGIFQVCHGKIGPLSRLKKGDGIIIYSPKEQFLGSVPCQEFTALGEVVDEEIYQVDMGDGFTPFRRRVRYDEKFSNVPIKPLINSLSFITNKSSWGMAFRYGLLKIPKEDFIIISGNFRVKITM